MAYTVKGRLSEVYLVRLEPQDDVLRATQAAIRELGIKTGVILDITGSVTQARVQRFKRVGPWQEIPVEVVEVPGPLEASGHGIIGQTEGSGGVGGYRHGEPYIHCHVNLTSAEQTICGHLMEGTYVRSHHPKSHFTVVLAAIEGALLTKFMDVENPIEETPGKFRVSGYHKLEQTD